MELNVVWCIRRIRLYIRDKDSRDLVSDGSAGVCGRKFALLLLAMIADKGKQIGWTLHCAHQGGAGQGVRGEAKGVAALNAFTEGVAREFGFRWSQDRRQVAFELARSQSPWDTLICLGIVAADYAPSRHEDYLRAIRSVLARRCPVRFFVGWVNTARGNDATLQGLLNEQVRQAQAAGSLRPGDRLVIIVFDTTAGAFPGFLLRVVGPRPEPWARIAF